MNECEVEINGKRYVSVESITDGMKRIVILQRGWVMVGDYSRDGESCLLENASVIRVWGTTKGLGEIAIDGPTQNTKLDPCGTVRFNILTTVAMMDCNKEAWK
jgi:hypothetical protein